MRKQKITFLIFTSLFILTSNIYSQWFEQATPVTAGMRGMVFFDANTGIISYQNGQVFRTTNSGTNWLLALEANVLTLKKVDDSAAFGLGAGVLIYKTTDRGLTWNGAGSSGESVRDCFFVNRDTGWFSVSGAPSGIYKSTNGGQSMFLISQEAAFGVINFLKQKYNGEYFGWHIGNGLTLTTNSGVNWYKPSNGLDSLDISGFFVTFINSDTGWAGGTTNFGQTRILKTTNRGLTWVKQFQEGGLNGSEPIFINARNGWGTRSGTKIYATTNGGQNWGFQNIPITTISYISMIDSLTGWAGYTKLIHTTNGGGNIVKIRTDNNFNAQQYILRQNYPNPFNPSSMIEFSIKDKANVSLVIYDIQGKEIMKLFSNKDLIPGEYRSIADFSNSNLSSGIYFYKLIIQGKENLTLTKKMTFVK